RALVLRRAPVFFVGAERERGLLNVAAFDVLEDVAHRRGRVNVVHEAVSVHVQAEGAALDGAEELGVLMVEPADDPRPAIALALVEEPGIDLLHEVAEVAAVGVELGRVAADAPTARAVAGFLPAKEHYADGGR